jgi:DNA-binding LacI/PurR family transcriptional regulator
LCRVRKSMVSRGKKQSEERGSKTSPPTGGSKKGVERVGIRAVARLAGVSIATVSRTPNGAVVDPKMAKQVRKAVHECGYVPNTLGRALVSGRSKILGVIISNLTNPFFPELIQRFEDFVVERGYEILVGATYYDENRMSHCVRRMIERNVDGVAVMSNGIDDSSLEQLAQLEIPLVLVDRELNSDRTSVLRVDYHSGIRAGVQHLAVLGHRNIAFVSGPAKSHPANLRLTPFSRSLLERGLQKKSTWIVEGDHTVEGGRRAMKQVLALRDFPTAVMCSNDMTAIWVLHTLHQEGLRVPEDLSVIGFDDIGMARVTIPPLTTIKMSQIEIARASVAALCVSSSSLQNLGNSQN